MNSKIELDRGRTIVFIGDSITDAGRIEPAYQPFGYGYVHFVANMLLAGYPELNLNIINTGVHGDTIRSLKARWEKDCISHRPAVVSVLIGVNDLWRQHAEPERLVEAVYPQEYEFTYRRLLSQAKDTCRCRFILMEPFMFCSNTENEMFKDLQAYISIVNSLSQEFDAVLVPLQKKIDEQIKQVPAEKWSIDSVHPYLWAHAWIARQWFKATTF